MRKRILNKLSRDETGQILMMVMLLMLFGSLIVGSVLPFMGTGLRVGKEVYEEKMYRLYAADAGVEDALWQIKNDKLSSYLTGYDEYKYDYPYLYPGYPNSLVLNNKNVGVSVENVWVPPITGAGSIPVPSTSQEALNISKYGNTTGESQVAPRLIITGNPSQTNPATKYQIGITYYYGTEGTDALYVKSIGIWLPPGFRYVSGSGNFTGASVDNHSYKGGEAVVWTFSSYPKFKSLPGVTATNPMVSTITFGYKADTAGQTPSCVSWISTSGAASVGSIPYAWDADKKVYGINSVAKDADTEKNVTVDAYALKTDPRELGSGRSGDYVAIGNSLMMPDTSDPTFRNRLLKESSATITSYSGTGEAPLGQIPANATVQAAYLYWSGFIDHYYWWYKTTNPGKGWHWSDDTDNATGTLYDATKLSQLITNSKVNTVSFGANGVMQNVTATQWQVCFKGNDSPNCWYYTCLYDATDLVKQLITAGKLGANGNGTYTLGHVSGVIKQTPPRNITISFPRIPTAPSSDHTSGYSFTLYDKNGNSTSDYTGYPLGTPATKLPGASDPYLARYNASYAGWSLVIIYSSPNTQGHQLYLYDIKNPNFKFVESLNPSNPDFDGDGNPGGKISGFLVPQRIGSEPNAAKITCFVGEGDNDKTGDSFKVNNTKLPDGMGGSLDNVWNSQSLGLSAPGVDIDTFYVTWASNLLKTGDTWAQIDIPTTGDGFTLSYIILSFRSTVTTGGTISYLVR